MLLNFSLKKLNKTGLVAFLLTQPVALHAEIGAPGRDVEDKYADDSSQWPERMRMDREIIPPPPPGPYMSLALSNAKHHSFKRDLDKPGSGFETADTPMETFSPDIPWPDNVREPNPWVPKDGYRFVQPSALQNLNQAQPYVMPNTPYGYYSPGYRYPYYQYQPPTNYYYGAPVNPVNRAPYPTSNKPSYPN